ncbi:CvpA family protein [Kineothrix sedimenti]|uniref:CvpA family protein n=1 Tax=Kineothrix sedimenti TaxID=3123317 RepID=A0ABZ3EW35_9FIRM
MNLLVIIFIAFALWRALRGFKNGFAKEVNSLVSLFMALVVLSMALLLFASVMEKNTKTIIISVVLLVAVSMVYRLIGVLMKSLETIAKLPVINLINKLLGIGAGALEVLAVFWIIYVIIGSFPTGQFGEKVMEWTHQSTILVNIYNKNYIANWIAML